MQKDYLAGNNYIQWQISFAIVCIVSHWMEILELCSEANASVALGPTHRRPARPQRGGKRSCEVGVLVGHDEPHRVEDRLGRFEGRLGDGAEGAGKLLGAGAALLDGGQHEHTVLQLGDG